MRVLYSEQIRENQRCGVNKNIPDDIQDPEKYSKITVYVAKDDGQCYISTTKDLSTDEVIEILETSLETFINETESKKEKEYVN